MKNDTIPLWLKEEHTYAASKDSGTFINKTIVSIIKVLSKIKYQKVDSKYRMRADIKLASVLLLIILSSLSQAYTFVVILDILLFVIICLLPANQILRVLKFSIPVTLFTCIILLPSAIMGNVFNSILIILKVFASVTMVSLVSMTTTFYEMNAAYKQFFIPNIFVMVLDMTIKYIVLLGDLSLNMLYALKLRSVGVNKEKQTSMGNVAGVMFLKSKEMAEDTYSAMECRGFVGVYKRNIAMGFHVADAILLFIDIAFVAMFVYFLFY